MVVLDQQILLSWNILVLILQLNILLTRAKAIVTPTDSSNFLQEILEAVDKLITQRLNEFARGEVMTAVSAAMTQIDTAGDNPTEWGRIPLLFSGYFPKVFRNCWGTEGSACGDWRTGGSAGQGLLLELQFTQLMILSAATVAKHGHAFSAFATHVSRAAQLTRNHYNTFKAYRTNTTNGAAGGLTKGSVSCPNPRTRRTCLTSPSRDNLMGTDFCALSSVRCPTARRCSEARATAQRRLDDCHNAYRNSISTEINRLASHHQAASNAAAKLVSASR